jgi:predicted transcriptional regulator
MARRRQPRTPQPEDLLGSLEARVMETCWAAEEPVTVNEVLDELNAEPGRDLAYNTVMSVMARLASKGLLDRTRDGRAYRYRPTSDRDGFIAGRASQAARQLIDEYGDLAVAGFVQSIAGNPQLRDQVDRLLAEAEDDEG